MNRASRKLLLAVGFAVALAAGGALSAQAVTTQSTFSTVVPAFQQSHYWEYQNKTTSSASQVYFSSIGAGYTMNVKAQNTWTVVTVLVNGWFKTN